MLESQELRARQQTRNVLAIVRQETRHAVRAFLGATSVYSTQIQGTLSSCEIVHGRRKLSADSGKFESKRLCSYNRGTTWGDVECVYFCSILFWRPLVCGPSNCTFPLTPCPP